MADTADDIRRWRMRAEELRTLADRFVVPSVQAALRRAADNYDRLAGEAEARFTGRPSLPGEEAG